MRLCTMTVARFQRIRARLAIVAIALVVGLLSGGCPTLAYNPCVEPEDFVGAITNTYLPMTPGQTFVYVANVTKAIEVNRVEVTSDTKVILGVSCTVVHDTVTLDGDLVEDTLDWYAQDEEGNVWYFGEDSKQYENGVLLGTEGSWEAGVDGARPGIVIKAHPCPGQTYRQEFLPDVAEDMAHVAALHESVTVPYGSFPDCLKTREFTRLEPGVVECKYYAPGVGLVLVVEEDGNRELTDIETR